MMNMIDVMGCHVEVLRGHLDSDTDVLAALFMAAQEYIKSNPRSNNGNRGGKPEEEK